VGVAGVKGKGGGKSGKGTRALSYVSQGRGKDYRRVKTRTLGGGTG